MQQEQLLYQVAKLYHVQHKTQLEISRILRTSRSTVSRLLQRAVDLKIVRVRICYPWRRDNELEARLAAKFNLPAVRVLGTDDRSEDSTMAGVGVLAAQLFEQSVRDGDTIGFSYGRSVAGAAAAMAQHRSVTLKIVPMVGGLGSGEGVADGPQMLQRVAELHRSQYHHLPAPLLAKDHRSREMLLRLPQVSRILELAKHSDVALVGVGVPSHGHTIWDSYLNRQAMDTVLNKGGVGYMCGQFFDESGKVLSISANQRSISIGLDALRAVPKVIAVASGEGKVAAIRGALYGGFFNALVTDADAAQGLLQCA